MKKEKTFVEQVLDLLPKDYDIYIPNLVSSTLEETINNLLKSYDNEKLKEVPMIIVDTLYDSTFTIETFSNYINNMLSNYSPLKVHVNVNLKSFMIESGDNPSGYYTSPQITLNVSYDESELEFVFRKLKKIYDKQYKKKEIEDSKLLRDIEDRKLYEKLKYKFEKENK